MRNSWHEWNSCPIRVFHGSSKYHQMKNRVEVRLWLNFTVVVTKITGQTRTPAFWDTPCRPMITHTTDAYLIAKSKICQKFKFYNFELNIMGDTPFWSCLIRCVNMKWILLVLCTLQTEWTRFHPQMDKWTKWNQYTPFNYVERGV